MFFGKFCQCSNEIGTDGATDATIAHFDNLFSVILNEDITVDIFFSEFIFNHGNALLVIVVLEDPVQEGSLTGT